MIRRESGEGWTLITQPSHAFLSSRIMNFWGNEDFETITPRDEVMLAIKEHDCGWEKTDSAADLNPRNGHPRNFMEMRPESQFEIWSECFERHVGEYPYACALIALHFSELNERTISKDPDNKAAVSLREKIGEFLHRSLGIRVGEGNPDGYLSADIRTNLRFLQVGDMISLALCHGSRSVTIPDVPINYLGDTVEIALSSEDGLNYTVCPNPFSRDSLYFDISGRKLGEKSFDAQAELKEAFHSAGFETFDFSISSGAEGRNVA
ncbi:MAG: DUF3891 family protein [Candidatus Dadabacteria bacterium]|nr:DUF3891 family protein [Candidatus Dadabacteria bacterium]